jgi:hypothetical protein
MWKYATDAEKDACGRLHRNLTANNPYVVDDTNIPQTPKTVRDPAPPAPAPAPAAPAPAPAAPAPAVAPAAPRAFPHMPSQRDITFDLPRYDPYAEGDNRRAMKRGLREAGLLHPDAAREAKRWHGTHILGEGASGIVTHWVSVDEHNNIDEVS